MKKRVRMIMIILLLCVCSVAAATDEVPESAKDMLSDHLGQGYSIARWFTFDESDYAYAILSKDGENRLFVLKKAGDAFEIEISSRSAIYQDARLPEIQTEMNAYFYLTYTDSNGQKEGYHYKLEDGTWNLYAYQTVNDEGLACFFSTRQNDRMEYSLVLADGPGHATSIYGEYQRALRDISIDALPNTLAGAREMLSTP